MLGAESSRKGAAMNRQLLGRATTGGDAEPGGERTGAQRGCAKRSQTQKNACKPCIYRALRAGRRAGSLKRGFKRRLIVHTPKSDVQNEAKPEKTSTSEVGAPVYERLLFKKSLVSCARTVGRTDSHGDPNRLVFEPG